VISFTREEAFLVSEKNCNTSGSRKGDGVQSSKLQISKRKKKL